MGRDHYEVLGVASTSEDVVIRAAYRALMRRYHPDKGPSADMSDRALEINAAYVVLGDPDKRARYDGWLAAAGMIKPVAAPRRVPALPAIPRPRPAAVAGFVALAAFALVVAFSPPLAEMPGAPALLGDRVQSPEMTAPAVMQRPAAAAEQASAACNGDAAAAAIKAEIFRRAALLRGSEGARFGAAADRALLRMQAEAAAPAAAGDAVRCSGWLALDLPPGLVVDGGRSNLNSEVHYAIGRASGRPLRVTDVSGAEALIAALGTMAPAAAKEDVPEPAAPSVEPAPARVQPALPPVRQAAAAPRTAPARQAAARPARPPSGCRYSTARSAEAICGSANLAALDRSLDQFYAQSLGRADEARKAELVASSASFASRRDACRSQSCLTAAYLERMREVSAIMARKGQP